MVSNAIIYINNESRLIDIIHIEMNREEYRQLCKHYSPYSGQCYKKSIITGVANNVHINMSCDGKCARMSNYDKKNTVVIYGNRRTNN